MSKPVTTVQRSHLYPYVSASVVVHSFYRPANTLALPPSPYKLRSQNVMAMQTLRVFVSSRVLLTNVYQFVVNPLSYLNFLAFVRGKYLLIYI